MNRKEGGHIYICRWDGRSIIFVDECGNEIENFMPYPVNKSLLDIDFNIEFTSYELSVYLAMTKPSHNSNQYVTYPIVRIFMIKNYLILTHFLLIF